MSRIIPILFVLFLAAPVQAGLVSYDYHFNYYDITDCEFSCSPEGHAGTGQLLVDKTDNTLRQLTLNTDSFVVDWAGNAGIHLWEESDWPIEDGDFYYAQTGINSADGYSVSMLLDLFFVPSAAHPLDFLENAVEHDHFVVNGTSSWQLVGHFSKTGAVSVTEPTSALLLLLGLGLLVRQRRARA